MEKMDRVTVCFEKGILPRLDAVLKERGYKSRSQAVSDFLKRALTKREWSAGKECAGMISVVYPGERGGTAQEIQKLLLKNASGIVSVQTAFMGKSAVAAVLAKGRPRELERMADALRSVKGVSGGSFSISCVLE